MSTMPPMDNGFNDVPPQDSGFDGGMSAGGMGDSMPNQPVMDDGMNNMGGNPPMNNQMPMDGQGNEFDSDFDAGVEADEEQDPKKYIQQLTGKLSQSLRDYNKSLPQPDIDLDKYVAGMIVKQAIEGLSDEDTKDILDKVNSDEDFVMDDENNPDDNGNEMPMDNGMNDDMGGDTPPMDNGPQNQMESFNRKIEELTIKPGQEKDDQGQAKKLSRKKGYKVSPFLPK